LTTAEIVETYLALREEVYQYLKQHGVTRKKAKARSQLFAELVTPRKRIKSAKKLTKHLKRARKKLKRHLKAQ
jgi:hypothetical protein